MARKICCRSRWSRKRRCLVLAIAALWEELVCGRQVPLLTPTASIDILQKDLLASVSQGLSPTHRLTWRPKPLQASGGYNSNGSDTAEPAVHECVVVFSTSTFEQFLHWLSAFSSSFYLHLLRYRSLKAKRLRRLKKSVLSAVNSLIYRPSSLLAAKKGKKEKKYDRRTYTLFWC